MLLGKLIYMKNTNDIKKQNRTIAGAISGIFGAKAAASEPPDDDYQSYIMENDADEAELERQRRDELTLRPRFFAVLINRGRQKETKQTLASLQAQTYGEWELAEESGAAQDGTGYVIRLNAGDELSPDALYRFAYSVQRAAEDKPDMIYADEDEISPSGRKAPVFKPEFSRITALSYDLFGRILAIKQDIYAMCSPPGLDADEAEEYAFKLRCMAHAGRIIHIPKVLLHMGSRLRPIENSAGMAAIRGYIRSEDRQESVSTGIWKGSFIVSSLRQPRRVSIIIPNLNGMESLRRLLESIERCMLGYKYEIIIADGGSGDARLLKYYGLIEKARAAKVVRCESAGFATLACAGAERAMGDALLFLSRDAEVISPMMLGALIAQGERENVAAAGCMLISPNNRIVYTGGVIGLCGEAASPYEGEAADDDKAASLRRLMFTDTVRAVSVLSGACMYMRSDMYFSCGGFDRSFDAAEYEPLLPLGSDAELCLRLSRRGFCSVYTPQARLIMHTGLPRLKETPENVRVRCKDEFRHLSIYGDPYYNTAFDKSYVVPRVK